MNVPVLGFGTAPMLGSASRRTSEKALLCAYEAGIRHFDTARSYGWGEAEALLGQFIKRVPRSGLTLVSKCGIVPARRTPLLGAAKAAARAVISVAPQLRRSIGAAAYASSFRPTHSYDTAVLQRSFETTLSMLGTSYLDVLLLHNFDPGRSGLDEVVRWMEHLASQGRIRQFGFSIEGDMQSGLRFLEEGGYLPGAVIQAPMTDAIFDLRPEWASTPLLVHSPIKYLLGTTLDGSTGHEIDFGGLANRLSRLANVRAVICSMFKPSHIDANVAAWRRAVSEGDQSCGATAEQC